MSLQVPPPEENFKYEQRETCVHGVLEVECQWCNPYDDSDEEH